MATRQFVLTRNAEPDSRYNLRLKRTGPIDESEIKKELLTMVFDLNDAYNPDGSVALGGTGETYHKAHIAGPVLYDVMVPAADGAGSVSHLGGIYVAAEKLSAVRERLTSLGYEIPD